TVSRELGGEEELRALGDSVGIVLDIVPNHMGTGDENRWWPDPEIFDINPQTGFYRRFFDIDDMAAVRMEREEVFELVHGKVLELVRDGVVDGLRVDHPDGLADPAGYLRRLRAAGANDVWVEKILHPGEPLRDWALAALPVYRTYVEPWTGRVDDADRAAVEATRAPEELRRALLLEDRGHDEFVTRFQQTSPPVTAKGVEDTAFYRYNRLLALNEV